MHSPWRAFYRSNVEATRALIGGMKAGGSLVLTSTYGVYGFPNAGRPITEDYEPKRPLWHYQRSKWMQEEAARALCRERGIRFLALRPPTVIGPREMLSVPSLTRIQENDGAAFRLVGLHGPYSSFTVAYVASNEVLDDRRIRERLGFAPAYDLQRTVKESVDWYLKVRPRGR
jgi:nucleoside-diphosphate-sugar epimerase